MLAMVIACGYSFTAVVREQGNLWAFGTGNHGVLGLWTDADKLLPALVGGADEVFDGEAVVMCLLDSEIYTQPACLRRGRCGPGVTHNSASWGMETGR